LWMFGCLFTKGWKIFIFTSFYISDETGQPTLIFEGRVKELCDKLGVKKAHISLTHEHEYAIANVILERW
jgi:holo-[acyl-carrier-protein] synthase